MSSITCGNCKGTHTDVASVKMCYNRTRNTAPRVVATGHEENTERHYTPRNTYSAPSRPVRETFTVEDSGIYKNGDKFYKVYQNQTGTAMLAKELVPTSGDFIYVGAAYRFVKRDQKLSLEDAKKYGKIYGVCMKCGRTLTDETSIANGIGPICADKW